MEDTFLMEDTIWKINYIHRLHTGNSVNRQDTTDRYRKYPISRCCYPCESIYPDASQTRHKKTNII